MRGKKASCSVAKDRLKDILLSEKMQSSPEIMEQMKKELCSVIRKYMNTGHLRMEIQIQFIRETKQGAEYVKTIQIKRL